MSNQPITLRDMGSFHVGGRVVDISGKAEKSVTFSAGGVPARIDPNGAYLVEAMYVQYFLPAQRKGKFPLLMWHGGGLSGVTYETTPDGREGWLTLFLRKGWDIYNSDAVERGRSGFAPPDVWNREPHFVSMADAFVRHRIGAAWSDDPAARARLPGGLFPVEAYDTFARQFVPRWTTTDAATFAAYNALIDKVGPSVLLFHSQAGGFGFPLAQARPDMVKAIVAVEPAIAGDVAQAARLKDVPVLMLYGDFIEGNARWLAMRQIGLAFADAVKAAGGHVDVLDLPGVGMRGNSHMMMMTEIMPR
ncbi:MAG TPA: esterase [Pseudolabrys sp.]|nr:esterase [Pseudolabrys sp.]